MLARNSWITEDNLLSKVNLKVSNYKSPSSYLRNDNRCYICWVGRFSKIWSMEVHMQKRKCIKDVIKQRHYEKQILTWTVSISKQKLSLFCKTEVNRGENCEFVCLFKVWLEPSMTIFFLPDAAMRSFFSAISAMYKTGFYFLFLRGLSDNCRSQMRNVLFVEC